MFNANEVLLWCFQQNYHLDMSNAAVHCSPVRFSPITFRLYEALVNAWDSDEFFTSEMLIVKTHHGTYEEDRGRISEDG